MFVGGDEKVSKSIGKVEKYEVSGSSNPQKEGTLWVRDKGG